MIVYRKSPSSTVTLPPSLAQETFPSTTYSEDTLPAAPGGLCCTMAHLPACQDVARQLDFGKVSLADGLEQTVVADVRLLVWAGGDGVPAPGTQRAAGLARGLVCAAGTERHMLQDKRGASGRGDRVSTSMTRCSSSIIWSQALSNFSPKIIFWGKCTLKRTLNWINKRVKKIDFYVSDQHIGLITKS